MIKRFFYTIKDEYKRFLNDSGIVLIIIAGVIMYSLFYVLPYYTEVLKNVPIGVVDNDQSNLSRTFIKNLNATDYVDVSYTSTSVPDLEHELFENNIFGFVSIPKGFEKDILRGTQTNLSIYVDSAYLIIYKSVYTGIMHTAINLGAKIEIAKLMKKGLPKKMAMTLKQPFEFVETPIYNAAGGYKTYVYPCILILILHQTLIVGLGLLQGTRNELRENYCKKEKDVPFTLFARSTAYVILYLFYSIFIFLIYPAIFVYPMSYNLIPLMIVLILMLYSAAFFAHAIAYFFKTRESSLLLLVVTSLVFIFFPGIIWPKESIPQIINLGAMFIPATSSMDSIIKVNQMYANLWDIKENVLWLLFLCILYFNIACFVLKLSFKKKNNNN